MFVLIADFGLVLKDKGRHFLLSDGILMRFHYNKPKPRYASANIVKIMYLKPNYLISTGVAIMLSSGCDG